MSNPRLPRPKTMMLISALLCIALVPILHALVNRNAEFQQNYDKIANKMTESDRRQLNHNFKVFQKLPPEKQEQYRQLHAQLQEHKALQTVLLDYNEFLRSLDPVDRSEIERQKDYWGKRNAIKNVTDRLNDESQRYQELLQQSFADNQRRSNSHGRERGVPLNPDEIAALTRVLESHQKLTSTQRTQLDLLKGVDRLARILSITLSANGGSETKPFFTSQLVHELIAALSEERQEYFQRSAERREEARHKFDEAVKAGEADVDDPPFYLRKSLEEHHEMILIGTCLFTIHRALDDAAPSPEEMPAFLKQLPADDREELLTKHPGNLYDELVKEYHNRTQSPLYKSMQTIQDQFFKRIPKGFQGRRPGGQGRQNGGGGRPGDRERPREFPPRERRDENDDREARGAGFPERFRNFRNERGDDLKPDNTDTLSSED